jgi:hypothetical protein
MEEMLLSYGEERGLFPSPENKRAPFHALAPWP